MVDDNGRRQSATTPDLWGRIHSSLKTGHGLSASRIPPSLVCALLVLSLCCTTRLLAVVVVFRFREQLLEACFFSPLTPESSTRTQTGSGSVKDGTDGHAWRFFFFSRLPLFHREGRPSREWSNPFSHAGNCRSIQKGEEARTLGQQTRRGGQNSWNVC